MWNYSHKMSYFAHWPCPGIRKRCQEYMAETMQKAVHVYKNPQYGTYPCIYQSIVFITSQRRPHQIPKYGISDARIAAGITQSSFLQQRVPGWPVNPTSNNRWLLRLLQVRNGHRD